MLFSSIERWCGKIALLHPDHEHDRELQALGVVHRHQRHEALVVADAVRVGEQRDLLQELAEARALGGVDVVLARDPHELLEVLQAALGLDRALGLERVAIPGVVEQVVEDLRDGRVRLHALAQALHRVHEAIQRLARRLRQPRHLAARGVPHGQPGVVGVGQHAAQRRLPDPAPRRVRDPRERRPVLRVDQELQVLHRVLDLRPLVELRAADDLVGDLRPHEHVLQHPRLRVGPVEDRDLGAAHALVHQPLDLGRHPPRLGVLVRHLADPDLVALPQVRPQVLDHLPAVVRRSPSWRRRGSSASSGSSAPTSRRGRRGSRPRS